MSIQWKAISMAASLVFGMNSMAEELIANFDFTKPGQEWHQHAKGAFDGSLPEGLEPDFPGWNKSQVKAELIEDGNQSFTRFTVKSFESIGFRTVNCRFGNDVCCKIETICRATEPPIIQLRQKPAPYSFYYVAKTNSCSEKLFVKTTLYANLVEKPDHDNYKDIAFFLCLGDCETDIQSIKLTKISNEELAQLMQRPEKGVVNFFRNSRFPLGMQSGWNFEQGNVEADQNVLGPSGSPSLKLRFDKASALFSEPFQTNAPETQNHIAFSYQSKGNWTAALSDNFGRSRMDLHVLARQTLKESGEWTSVRMDFMPAPKAKSFTLALLGQGTLRLDSLRAWAGEDARSYVSQGECEVALALPKTETSIARIQFDFEPATLNYVATGDVNGSVLKLKAANLYGEENALPEIANPSAGQIDFSSALKDKPFGQFRIESWLERDGKRISPFNEMIVTRIRKPVHWNEDAPDSPFGCHFNPSPVALPMMKAAGVNWARLHDAGTEFTGWYHLETEKGKWTFHDDDIKLYRDAKIKIYGSLQTAPPWASSYKDSGKKGFNGYFDRYWSVTDFDGWSNYVKTVCTRYKGVIDGYYIWNEPYGDGFLHDAYDSAKDKYLMKGDIAKDQARLCELAWNAAKEADPDVKIAGYNFTNNPPDTQRAVEAGAFNNCDFVDFHVYSSDMNEATFKRLMAPLLDADIRKPIHMSEGSGGLNLYGNLDGLYKHSIPWKNEGAAANFGLANQHCEFVARLLSYGVARVNLYSAHGCNYLGVKSDYLVLLGEDGYPHPGLVAFSNMAWHLEGRKCVKTIQLDKKLSALLFEGRGGTVAVIAGVSDGSYILSKSQEWRICDLFGNPSDGHCKGCLLYVDSPLPAGKLAEALVKR